jgi:iron(II)-dependent oxidoreductase
MNVDGGEDLERTRARTKKIVDAVSEGSLYRQVVDYLSPLAWDLGHIAEFEELWLVRNLQNGGGAAGLEGVYNPFENPREVRGELSLPRRDELLAHLDEVRDRAVQELAGRASGGAARLLDGGFLLHMICQHEAQHQETMLQALDVPAEDWGISAVDVAAARAGASGGIVEVSDDDSILIAAGPFLMGTDDRSRAYDNERPLHEVDLGAFKIDRFPASVRRWRLFMEDGGYERRELWSEEGAQWLDESGASHPQGWLRRKDDSWQMRRFGQVTSLDDREPVQHICYWEADAFARWAGGRLPSEAEWEKAAAWDPSSGGRREYPWGGEAPTSQNANLDGRLWGPAPIGRYAPGASAYGVEQMLGDVYEWTSSGLEPYPGFTAFPYKEYSEVFFGGPYRVLRGASWAIDSLVARNSYRNWDLPHRRQIFAGVRVARDVD